MTPKALRTGNLGWIGLGIFVAHLLVMGLNQATLFEQVRSWVPVNMQRGLAMGYFATTTANLLMEVAVLVASWLFVVCVLVLLDEEVDVRRLVAVLAICYFPVLTYSVVVFTAFACGWTLDFSALATATNDQEVARTIHATFPTIMWPLTVARNIAYLVAAALAAFAVRGVCRVGLFKATLALGALVALFVSVRVLFGVG